MLLVKLKSMKFIKLYNLFMSRSFSAKVALATMTGKLLQTGTPSPRLWRTSSEGLLNIS